MLIPPHSNVVVTITQIVNPLAEREVWITLAFTCVTWDCNFASLSQMERTA
jgi:hypothetical protein